MTGDLFGGRDGMGSIGADWLDFAGGDVPEPAFDGGVAHAAEEEDVLGDLAAVGGVGLAEFVVDDDDAGAAGGDEDAVGALDFAGRIDNRGFVQDAAGAVEPV